MADFSVSTLEREMDMKNMKKICFLINSMRGGGAERVLSVLLENLSRFDRKLFLIVLEDKFDYKIPSDIKIIKLFSNLQSNFKKFFGIFLGTIKLKKIIKNNQIDIVMSFLERSNYINILAKILLSPHKVYINERCNPSECYSDKSLKSFFNLFLVKKLYRRTDSIVVNSFGIKETLVKNFSINPKRIKVIYNLIDIEKIQDLSQASLAENYQKIFQSPVVINIGGLIKEKGQEHLIKVFEKVKKNIPEAKLLILGEGELESYLKNLTRKLSLENDVLFLGWQENPFKFLAQAKIFVLSSLSEGFPNVLVEAMVCRTPVISTTCQSGSNEIIENKKNGLLVSVGDEKNLTKAILQLLNNSSLAKKLSQEGEKRAKDFSVKNIIDKYEGLL